MEKKIYIYYFILYVDFDFLRKDKEKKKNIFGFI